MSDARQPDAAAGVFTCTLQLGGDGPRVAIKDSIDVQGTVTGMGSRCFAAAAPAARHAVVVQRLLEAGCRIVGKTNLHELAYGVTGINAFTGTPRNPRAPERIPGGSSSGSAVAVALQRVDFAVGTDTGGSIRIPAACCGVFGLKPTYGRINRRGVLPAASSLDCVGVFARDPAMLERAMAACDPSFTPRAAPPSLRLGRVEVACAPSVAAAVDAALAAAGVRPRRVDLPTLTTAFDASLQILAAENWAAFGRLSLADCLGADVRARLRAAREISAEQLAAAEATRRAFKAEVDAALAGVDALVLPTLPVEPPTLAAAGDPPASLGLTTLVRPFNLSGHPALSLPVTAAPAAPVGLQLVGRMGEEALLCALAAVLSESLAAGVAPGA